MSIRLDEQATRDLMILESSGLSRSEAIRKGLHSAARDLRRKDRIFAQAQLVAKDQLDRAEMLEVAAFMESMRAEG